MTGKYSLGKLYVKFWTYLPVKLVGMVYISITMYLCQEWYMWCFLCQKVYILTLPLYKKIYSILEVVTLGCFHISSMMNSKL